MLSPRGQRGLGAKILTSASASQLWPRPRPQPRVFGLGLASISLSYYVIGHFSCKMVYNSGILLIFPAIIFNHNYVVNLVLFHNYFWPRPRPRSHSPGLGLGLEVLASFNITAIKTVIRQWKKSCDTLKMIIKRRMLAKHNFARLCLRATISANVCAQ